MNIQQLCDAIHLQPEIKRRVADFADRFDFHTVEAHLRGFLTYEKMHEARLQLQTALGRNERNIKMLACMLHASAQAYSIYQEKGISDEIYVETMKCYTRFIGETYDMTGELRFDRDWWTIRQAGCHLFRIGDLEYEINRAEGNVFIDMHIPSDAGFSPAAVSESIARSREFFKAHFPEFAGCEYQCHSWLLDKTVRSLLSESSNILSFQNRFDIYEEGEAATDFIQWLFKSTSTDYESLPESTSLQRGIKKHILSGGRIYDASGRLR